MRVPADARSHCSLRPVLGTALGSRHQHGSPSGALLAHIPLRHQSPNESQQGTLHQGWHQSRHFRAQTSNFKDSKNTAEDCDRIVEELRYRNIKVPRQLDISYRRRIEGWLIAGWGATTAVAKFCLSLPGMLFRTLTMSPSQWYQTVTDLWGTIKHEAEYYWVCIFTLHIMFQNVSMKDFIVPCCRDLRTSVDSFQIRSHCYRWGSSCLDLS
jgi:hypothetical protein